MDANKPWYGYDHYKTSCKDAQVLFNNLTDDAGFKYKLRYIADRGDYPIRSFIIQVMELSVAEKYGVDGPDTIVTGLYGMVDVCARIVDGRRRHSLDNEFLVTVGPDWRDDQDGLVYYGSTPQLLKVYWAGDNINRYARYDKRDELDLTAPIKIGLLARYRRT